MNAQVDLPYLAGLIDADGHVGLHKVGEGRYAPQLSFVNTSSELIDLFQFYLGGQVYEKKKVKEEHTTTYEVVVRFNEYFLKACGVILPFLRLKKTKLLIAQEYAESIRDTNGKKLTPEVKAYRKNLREIWENTPIEMRIN